MTWNGKEFETRSTSTTTSRTASSSSTSSTTTSAYTLPGVSWDLAAIKESYNQVLGEMKAAVAWYIEKLLADGMEPEVVLNALQETAWARRPSPQYFRAICERYRFSGLKTMAQVLHDQQEHAQAKEWFED